MNDSDGMKCEKCGQFRSFLITVQSIDNWKKTRHFGTDWCVGCILMGYNEDKMNDI